MFLANGKTSGTFSVNAMLLGTALSVLELILQTGWLRIYRDLSALRDHSSRPDGMLTGPVWFRSCASVTAAQWLPYAQETAFHNIPPLLPARTFFLSHLSLRSLSLGGRGIYVPFRAKHSAILSILASSKSLNNHDSP